MTMGDRKPFDDLSEGGKRRIAKTLLEDAKRSRQDGTEPENVIQMGALEGTPEQLATKETGCVQWKEEFVGCANKRMEHEAYEIPDASQEEGEAQTPIEGSGECVQREDGLVDYEPEDDVSDNESVIAGDSDSELEFQSDSADEETAADNTLESNVVPDFEVDDRPLYRGAPLTFTESMIAILTLVISHNISGTLFADILILINLHLIQENNLFKNTLYKCQGFFKKSVGTLNKHFYCLYCYQDLGNAEKQCTSCINKCKNVSYFITISIVDQLRELFMRSGFIKKLQLRFDRMKRVANNIEDVYDGKLYKKMVEHGFLNKPHDISFMWYSDGVPVFKSTKCSMWPLYLVVNELPYKDRFKSENLILAGLWVGSGKPNANMFVNALAPEIRKLKCGVDCNIPSDPEPISVRAILLCGTCDLPAKSQFLNMIQFNGYFGCCVCEQKGERVALPNGNTTQAYPYQLNTINRTCKKTLEHANTALGSGKPEKGVKGVCALSKLMPDFITGTGIDVMHGVFSGVAKKLLELWFDPSYSGRAFSLSAVSSVVSDRLLKLKPPNFIERLPRSISDVCHWKATEFRTWFFYYSPCILIDLMKGEYYKHYLSLVKAIALLSLDSISRNNINEARELIHDFVRKFSNLYGVYFCTINVHQLLHLPDCVENLGPVWVYSCFKFEDINGQLLKLVHGTNYVASQISRSHWYRLRLPRYLEVTREGNVHDFVSSKRKRFNQRVRVSDGCFSVGIEATLNPIPEYISDFMSEMNVGRLVAWQYSRLFKDGVLYIAESYTRCVKSKSSFIEYVYDGVNYLGRILYFVKITNCDCNRQCNHLGTHYAYLEKLEEVENSFGEHQIYAPTHLQRCNLRVNQVRLVPVTDVRSLCIYLDFGDNNLYVGKLVNARELE